MGHRATLCTTVWFSAVFAATWLAIRLGGGERVADFWPFLPRAPAAQRADADADLSFAVDFDVPLELSAWFSRSVTVFSVRIFASKHAEDWALQHVGRGLAKFLDQDEDGQPDYPEVVQAMSARKAAMVLMRSSQEYEEGVAKVADQIDSTLAHGVIKNDHPIWNCSVRGVWVIAEIFQDECARDATEAYGEVPPKVPYGRWDAVWEEVFHLITHVGYGCAHPEVWGFRADAGNRNGYPRDSAAPSSNISRALDKMLGDCGAAYNGTQRPKHDGQCNYHYDDETCFYPCLVNEYLFTVHMVRLGALDARCHAGQREEYSFCTQAEARAQDPDGFWLGGYTLPQTLPSGHYRPWKD